MKILNIIIIVIIISIVIAIIYHLVESHTDNGDKSIAHPYKRAIGDDNKIKVFSFSLYGNRKKYCMGMIENAKIISQSFPNWQIWIYVTDDVPNEIRQQLLRFNAVRLFPIKKQSGLCNSQDRFIAIDDPRIDVMIVRDADSRVSERDASCINDFIESDKHLHIIRDHKLHKFLILAGMWGLKRGLLNRKISDMLYEFNRNNKNNSDSCKWGNDQDFLAQYIYPYYINNMMVHDEIHQFEPTHTHTSFRMPIIDNNFIGQVYEFDKDGKEQAMVNYEK